MRRENKQNNKIAGIDFVFRLFSFRKSVRKDVPDGREFIAVRANVRRVRCEHHRPRAVDPTTHSSAGDHTAVPQKQLQHHFHVGTGPVPAQDLQESSFVHGHDR